MKNFLRPSIVETLETRRLLASFASVNGNGTLSVVGTSKADTIVVQISGSKVQAILNGATESFTSSTVKRIWIEAFGGNDKITNKTSLESTLIGDAGNDTIIGGGANDTIQAGSGDDHFDGGLGNNQIDEGSGNDAFDYSSEPGSEFFVDEYSDIQGIEVIRGTPHGSTDTALQQPNLSTFIGTAGNDQVFYHLENRNGNGATFKFYLGNGNDSINSEAGSDEALLFDGGNGNDTLDFDIDDEVVSVFGDAGNDTINDDSGAQIADIDGGSGFDTDNIQPDESVSENLLVDYTVPAGIEKFSVGVMNNLIVRGNSLDNIISAWAGGNVTVFGNGGNDQITAVAAASNQDDTTVGHVSLDGGSGDDLLDGTGMRSSTLKGNSGNDTLIGDGGDFSYEGDSGIDTADFSDRSENLNITIDNHANDGGKGQTNNVESDVENVIGGTGNDFIAGNPSNNSIEGGAGDDTIWGSSGNDTLVGDAGHDELHGQDGNDLLYGKDGQTDTLDGGDGTDKASRDNSASVKDQVLSIESFI